MPADCRQLKCVQPADRVRQCWSICSRSSRASAAWRDSGNVIVNAFITTACRSPVRRRRRFPPCRSRRLLALPGAAAYHAATFPLRRRPMARVTVEDCVDKVENRFELVLLASHRARMISSRRAAHHRPRQRQEPGRRAARDRRRDRLPGRPASEDLIHSLQKYVEVDEPEAEAVPLIASPTPTPAARTATSPSTACRRKNCCAASKAWFRRTRPTISERRPADSAGIAR